MNAIVLSSPLSGWLRPLDAVPDQVFAGRMLGDGVAIDPLDGILHAPCAGEVVTINASGHAVTLRHDTGLEVLIHIGIDTVALGGRGFTPAVKAGDRVQAGNVLIRFDLDLIVTAAPTILTPVIVVDADRYTITLPATDRAVAVGEPLLKVTPRQPVATAAAATGERAERQVTVDMAHGIHARPAARIGDTTHRFAATVTIAKGDRTASATGPIALMGLAIVHGDTITIAATGADAAAAVAAVADLIEEGMGERGPAPAKSSAPAVPAPTAAPPVADGTLAGVVAAPGLALGTARHFRLAEIPPPPASGDPAEEHRRLAAAIATVATRLTGHAVLEAHRALLADPDLAQAAAAAIDTGTSAGQAWRDATAAQVALLRGTGDPRLAERADDLFDIERRLLAALAGREEEMIAFPAGTILLADDLLPSHMLALDPATVAGIVTAGGGPTSHVAILAQTLGLPALVATGPALASVAEGATVLLDTEAARLTIDPDADTVAAATTRIDTRTRRRTAAIAAANRECRTRDGIRIEAFANCGSASDAAIAVANGAEGCGLLRTEFLFLDRAAAPDIAEQTRDYQAVADALDGRPLIVRLLDIGGDKPAPYLPIAPEENPALGLRGIRVGLAHPDILDAQLRAILAVHPAGQCRIMVPMIAGLDELRAVRAALTRAAAATGHDGGIELGVMIETPAAAVTADLIAAEADFLSIGTNDLTQYTLAMDRGNPAVAGSLDALHPAVLRLIAQTASGGARHHRWTGVCGGLASDPLAIPILIGLGVTELSAAPAMVPELKALVAAVTLAECRALADRTLACTGAAEVREIARAFLKEHQA